MNAHQMPSQQAPHSGLDRAFGKPGCIGNPLMAEARRLDAAADGLSPQVQIDQVRRGCMIVAHQVAQQDVHDVVVNLL